jgi:CubicO group peptidase (beta-lactamase class C family)
MASRGKHLLFFAVALIQFSLFSAFSSARSSSMQEVVQQLVDKVYKDFVASKPYMGISVGVVTPDGAMYFNYGKLNVSGPSVTEDTLFAINSMSKVFTGIALAEHVASATTIDERKTSLMLDSPVQAFIADHKLPKDEEKNILFKDLATHWSGLERTPNNWADPDAADRYATYTDELFFECLANYSFTELHLRRQYLYSNLGFGLLAYVLSNEIDKSNFSGMMSNTFFVPLNMSRSGLAIDSKDVSNLAVGHSSDGVAVPWGWSCETVLGSWAVRSSTQDMVRFLRANIAASQGDQSSPLLKAMTMSHNVYRPTDTDGYHIGLGWRIEDATGTRMKSGSGDGQESNMYFNSEKNLGLVVLSNSFIDSPNDIDTTSTIIFNQLLDMYGEA